MSKGWICLYREIKEHWIWKSDNRFKWWIDMLLTVNHTDNKILIGNTLIDCKRGQSVKSLESWAKNWNVTKKTVSDFFNLLKKDNMIFTENLIITTRITICNYDCYNNIVNGQETVSKRQVNAEETTATHNITMNNNDNNKNNENKKECTPENFKFEVYEILKEKRKQFSENKNEIEKFINYWSEKNISGKKMKYQLEKTFQIELRLDRWFSNSEKFNQNKNNSEKRVTKLNHDSDY